MKRLMLIALATFATFIARADNWVYDPNGEIDYLGYHGGVVSDGTWKFKATVSGTKIKFGAVATNVYPNVVTPIDFSKPVEKIGDPSTTYTISELNDGFGFYRNGKKIPEWGYTSAGWDSVGWRPCCYRVGAITFPTSSGFTKIGDRFFTHCTNVTGVLNIPSSVTTIGTDLFRSCKKVSLDVATLPSGITSLGSGAFGSGPVVTGDLYLPSIKTIGAAAFYGTAITSARLGPDLTSIDGEASSGAFGNCTSMTNFEIDAAASCEFKNGGVFRNCTSLKNLHLVGVKKVAMMSDSAWYSHFQGSKIEKVYFSEKLDYLHANVFAYDTSLAEIHFYGMPPATLNTPVLGGIDAKQTVFTYVHLDEHATTYDYATAKAAWDAMTQGGELLEDGSTWSQAKAGANYQKRPLVLYVEEITGERGHWIYDATPAQPVVSNGVWTFKASLSGRAVTVKDVTGYPNVATEIDFSKSVTKPNGAPLYFFEISPKFGTSSGAGAAVSSVSKVIFPTNRLDSIGEYAFRGCANLTDIVFVATNGLTAIGSGAFRDCVNATNTVVLPSTLKTIGSNVFRDDGKLSFDFGQAAAITTIGESAFQGSGLSGDLVLTNMTSISSYALYGTKITSVKCGPKLTTVGGNWQGGAFATCTSLTNVTFDAEANIEFVHGGVFYGCSKLKELDLSGVANINLMSDNGGYSHFQFSGVEKVVFSEKIEFLGAYTFSGDSNLSEVHFYGMPPATLKTPVLGGVSASQAVTTYVHLDKDATTYDYDTAKAAWDAMTAGGELLEEGSTWSQAMAGANYQIRELLLYVPPEIGELGEWVYDSRVSPSVVSNGVWSFNATKSGRTISLGSVITYPSDPTELDFSKALTDHNGVKFSFFAISPHLGKSCDAWGFTAGPAAGSVSRLLLPTNNLYTIGDYAFCGCTNLTEVTPCLPDSVTTLGYAAFRGVKFAKGKGNIRLYGVTELPKHVFIDTTATSVYFGPALKDIYSQWHEGAFYAVGSLTNVVFDVGITNCTLRGSTVGPFEECYNLRGHLNLSGFSSIVNPIGSGMKVSSVSIGAGCYELVPNFISGSSLTNVLFEGRPPKTFVTDASRYLSGVDANQKVTTQIYWKNRKMTNSVGKCWMDYIAGDTLRRRDSTWAAEYVKAGIDLANRPLVAPDAQNGFKIILR